MTRDRLRATRTLVLLSLALAATGADSPGTPPSDKPVLLLGDGGFLSGNLVDSEVPDVLRWKNDSFAVPFDFIPARVDAIRWPTPKESVKPSGDFQFETAGGDLLFGSLVSLNDKEAELDVLPNGRIRLDRSHLKRISALRAKGEVVYVGPNGLAGWESPSPNGWREEGGSLVSDVPGASIRSDVGLPARASVEIELSWSKRSNFIVALGVGKDEESVRQAYRLEVIDDQVVALVETKTDADIAAVQAAADKPGRVHVVALIDSEKGRFVVVTPEGKKLADLRVEPRTGVPPGGVYLANATGDMRLERLRVNSWDGTIPSEAEAGSTRVLRKGGPVVNASKLIFEPGVKELVATTPAGESRIPLDQLTGIRFSPTPDDKARSIRLSTLDGNRVSGSLLKVADGAVWVSVPGIAGPLKLPIKGLRTLHPINQDLKGREIAGRNGLLQVDEARLKGWLVAGVGRADSSCLVWQPAGSRSASPLRSGVSGKIVYKETKVEKPAVPQQTAIQMRRMVIMNGGQATAPTAPVVLEPGKRLLHLRSGDMVVAEITKIDEDGVWFKSDSSDKTFVAHDKVKAVELGPPVRRTVVLNRTKFDRLLTLPRMQKGSPPTHLLRSVNGDYLRGRVAEMDDKKLNFEVRLDNREIPRDRIARITWFHADESDPAKPQPVPAASPGLTRVHAVRPDGIRLTFLADRFADGMLQGQSEVFGGCRVRPEDIDQILIGGAIDRTAAELAQQQWKLHNAPDPKYAQEGADQDSGTESDLIGKPAPDFTLDLVGDGKKTFRLGDAKGSIVILDFWATWCGPCLQAMPQVEKVADEFKDRGVKLIAVNLQETPDKITALLTRLKLHPTVALDRDGVVAGKYKAAAIPQTVIIDRDGNVARLFVGSSPDLQEKLREAVDSLLNPKKPDAPKAEAQPPATPKP